MVNICFLFCKSFQGLPFFAKDLDIPSLIMHGLNKVSDLCWSLFDMLKEKFFVCLFNLSKASYFSFHERIWQLVNTRKLFSWDTIFQWTLLWGTKSLRVETIIQPQQVEAQYKEEEIKLKRLINSLENSFWRPVYGERQRWHHNLNWGWLSKTSHVFDLLLLF